MKRVRADLAGELVTRGFLPAAAKCLTRTGPRPYHLRLQMLVAPSPVGLLLWAWQARFRKYSQVVTRAVIPIRRTPSLRHLGSRHLNWS